MPYYPYQGTDRIHKAFGKTRILLRHSIADHGGVIPESNAIIDIRTGYNGNMSGQMDEIFLYTDTGVWCVKHVLIITF